MTTDDWIKLLQIGAGAGASIYGASQANQAANAQNANISQSQQQLYELAQQEKQRRDQLTSLFLPSMLKSMGIQGSPSVLGGLYQQAGGFTSGTQAPATNSQGIYPGQGTTGAAPSAGTASTETMPGTPPPETLFDQMPNGKKKQLGYTSGTY